MVAVAVGLAGYLLVAGFMLCGCCYPLLQRYCGRGWIPRAFFYLLVALAAFFSELIAVRLRWTKLVEEGLTGERAQLVAKVEIALAVIVWVLLILCDFAFSTVLGRPSKVSVDSQVGL